VRDGIVTINGMTQLLQLAAPLLDIYERRETIFDRFAGESGASPARV